MSRMRYGSICLMCGYRDRGDYADEGDSCPRCESPSYSDFNSHKYDKYEKYWLAENIELEDIDYALLKFLWRMDVRQARDELRRLYSDRLVLAMEPDQRLSHIKNEIWSFIESGLEDIKHLCYGDEDWRRDEEGSYIGPWLPAISRRQWYQENPGRDEFLKEVSSGLRRHSSEHREQWKMLVHWEQRKGKHRSDYVACYRGHQSPFVDDWVCNGCVREREDDPEGYSERWNLSFARPAVRGRNFFGDAKDIGNQFQLAECRVHE